MPWHVNWPVGTASVKTNRPTGQENTQYIQDTMRADHFWDQGGLPSDGHHNVIQMPTQFSGVPFNPPAPTLPMAGEIYVRNVSGGAGEDNSSQLFYQQFAAGQVIYQITPFYITGQTNIANENDFVEIYPLPKFVYGEIIIWKDGTRNIQVGNFMSDGTAVEGFSNREKKISTSNDYFVELRNGAGVNASLQARVGTAGSGGFHNWKIFFRGIVDI